MVDELKKQKIIQAIRTAPNDEKLAEYLFNVSKALKPTRYEPSTISIHGSILEILCEEKPNFALKLSAPQFASLSSFFFLTTGLHVVGAMSGHGKTFWSLQWAKECAQQGFNVLVLSLEMTPKDLSARTLAEISDLPLMQIIQRNFRPNQKRLLGELIEEPRFEYLKRIHIETFGDYDWQKIYPRLWERMIQLQPKLIIVDYVQMLSNSSEDDRASKVLGDIARELKLFADSNEAAALVLSQLNREAAKEARTAKIQEGEPMPMTLHHVKESGGIVEAADSVQIVCIPQRMDRCPHHLLQKFQVSVQKSRRLGMLGTKLFNMDVETMKFL